MDQDDWWAHGLWSFIGIAVALPTLSRPFWQGAAMVLADHRVMFLGAFTLYFLFGATLLSIGPENQIEHALNYYRIGAKDALRVDAVNAIGFGIALLTSTFARGRWLEGLTRRTASRLSGVSPRPAIWVFLVVGSAASFYLLSFDLGFSDGLAPGAIRSASKLSLVAIFLAAANKGRGETTLRYFAVALTLMLALFGVLQFNKGDALLPIASLVAGLAFRFRNGKILLLGVALLAGGFLWLGSIAEYGRGVVGDRGASLSARWEITLNSMQDTMNFSREEQYVWWSRLCYTPPQVAAMDFWDAGRGGDGVRMIPWLVVPRFLAPEKPEITKTGREFHEKITGRDTSNTGHGIFVSGYYHGGWWGFWFASIVCGWIIAQTSAIAGAVIENNSLNMVPLCLLGLFIAFRIDGDFVSDYLGVFVILLYLFAAMHLLTPLIIRPRHGLTGPREQGWR